MNKTRIGSTLDSLFEETGELEEVRLLTHKKIIARQIEEAMRAHNVSKAEMARRMRTSRVAVDRLVSPRNRGLTLDSLERASTALGCELQVRLVPKKVAKRATAKRPGPAAGGTTKRAG